MPDNNFIRRFAAAPVQGPTPDAPGGRPWAEFMEMALAEARICASMGEIPVGAVLLGRRGEILAKAGNRVETLGDPTAHAEILALRAGAKAYGSFRLSGCFLISTLEPCLMCAGAIGHARIAGLVFGARDSVAGAIVSRADYYDLPASDRGLWHMGGVEAQACADILRDFFSRRR